MHGAILLKVSRAVGEGGKQSPQEVAHAFGQIENQLSASFVWRFQVGILTRAFLCVKQSATAALSRNQTLHRGSPTSLHSRVDWTVWNLGQINSQMPQKPSSCKIGLDILLC